MSLDQLASSHGAEVNQNGGMYVRGKAYDLLKKLQVAEAYIKKKEGGERRPNLKRIASECGVSWAFVSKIEQEILVHERVLSPEEIRAAADRPTLPGAIILTDIDRFVLYMLLKEQPSRILQSYQSWLVYFTGTVASLDTISRFLKEAFP